jgi:5'-phosphate synthase pdxT subunit
VLAESEGQPVMIRQGHILIATFHPELTNNSAIHEYFLRMVADHSNGYPRSFGVSSKIATAQVEPR